MSELVKYSEQTFESIKHVNEYGEEYWLARELQGVLEYARWENFNKAIERAKKACTNTGFDVEDHFREVTKMVPLGSGAEREIDDVMLSRYACYLVVMNGDPNKEVIAVGQTYFAVKTRQQELIDNYEQLSEDQKRLAIRNEMIAHNKSLAEAAQMAGVEDPRDYAIFQNKGYQGLYGGLGAKEIHARKGLKKSFVGRISKESRPRMTLIMRSERRFARLLRNWAAPCQKICPHQKRALLRSSVNRKSES